MHQKPCAPRNPAYSLQSTCCVTTPRLRHTALNPFQPKPALQHRPPNLSHDVAQPKKVQTTFAQKLLASHVGAHRFLGALVGGISVRIQLELVEQLQRRLLHIVMEVQLRASAANSEPEKQHLAYLVGTQLMTMHQLRQGLMHNVGLRSNTNQPHRLEGHIEHIANPCTLSMDVRVKPVRNKCDNTAPQ